MRKRTSDASSTSIRIVVVTLDAHLVDGVARARAALERDLPGLSLSYHVAAEWAHDPAALERCRAAIEQGDIIIAHMLFMDDHIEAVYPWLARRRDHCDAMIGCMSAEKVAALTRMGRFTMAGGESGILAKLKQLRGKRSGAGGPPATAGARQAKLLRAIPQVLRFVPGTAQDLRAYLLTMQYWLAGSAENVENMVRFLVNRYASGERSALRGRVVSALPAEYPATGLYHPALRGRVTERFEELPGRDEGPEAGRGAVALLLMRSYVLAGNTAHYDGVIDAFEKQGLRVVPIFSSGLDARPAIERFLFDAGGRCRVEALVSLTGFSLVGGPAYNDARSAEEMLARLDVPYLVAQAVEFQDLGQWEASETGLATIEATMMVAIPELDGATGPIVFGGQGVAGRERGARAMSVHAERAAVLASRVARLVELRRSKRAERRVGIVLFNFPPNAGKAGTAMHLAVFESLHQTLVRLAQEGYTVEVPSTVEALRERIVGESARASGLDANVHARIPVDDHVRREPWLREIEAQWGPAPGRQLTDGRSLLVLGARFGNVLVGVQPSFGYEGDPMRMLFDKGLAPTHAFSAFYRYLREDFGASVLLHFGTHGALEFLPGKQVGLSRDCWPDRLIGDVPNVYLYAANNPSEGVIAKRRCAATLVSYLTPPIARAGLYAELGELGATIGRFRACAAGAEPAAAREALVEAIAAKATALDFYAALPDWSDAAEAEAGIESLAERIREIETTLVPTGLHVVGTPPTRAERIELLTAAEELVTGDGLERAVVEAIVEGRDPKRLPEASGWASGDGRLARIEELQRTNRLLAEEHELPALVRALDGRFIRPAPGGDLLKTPDVLPTGRNVHGFDPFRIPGAAALVEGARLADRLLERHLSEGNRLPESIAIVLWGSDNLKSEGASIGQVLALMGARPRFDSYGRLSGAALIPLAELARPRIDVVMTLSGIFRDLFPFQTRLLAEAAFLAASADEPIERNFVRKHALAYQAEHGGDLESASLRVFSNANGAYGANVSAMVQGEQWSESDELAETFSRRKSFAHGRTGATEQRAELLESVLAGVELAYQNLESVDLGVTTVDVYFDNLGGITSAIRRAGGEGVPVYIGDPTQGDPRVRTLTEQVALETRTRVLNPKWFEGMLRHGFEGVSQIESHVTNTLGWSATTGQVDRWVYRELADTFVLDEAMRNRLAALNPAASVKLANRLLEAQERDYWTADPQRLDALRRASAELEDQMEGINLGVAAA